MSNWSKNLCNSHSDSYSHLNLKRIAIPNSHSDENFQNSIPIRIRIPDSRINSIFNSVFAFLCKKNKNKK